MRKKAFTLIEVLAVITIIALVSLAGGSMMKGTIRHMTLKKAAKDIAMSVKCAKILAVENKQNVRLCIDQEQRKVWIAYNDFDIDSDQTVESVVKDNFSKPIKFDDIIEFQGVQIAPGVDSDDQQCTSIAFAADGSCDAAVIQLGDGKNHYTINIIPSIAKAEVKRCTVDQITAVVIDLDKEAI
jgi:prepilin-type N-terminal cleavage/methylation domain-containing protein